MRYNQVLNKHNGKGIVVYIHLIYIGIRFHHRCKQTDFLQIATVFRLQR